ncbi:pilus assembly protein PilO [Desulfolithobacter dissulfuricans]|uniref:Pilus assembly protein PilO n=1 Tax=Desulfolithobacter dissulfuricans TaxID=2795293 RepID=A0A915XL94_9BACT|nr:type 4a pilus biogenesis protein PilO [Desulfolithobacter dissulfuricans]BCO10348.1 pilus assembly protein PilO [Desulfolithobacter dissulfuricans]
MTSISATSKLDTFIDEKYLPLDKKVKLGITAALFLLPVLLFYFLIYMPGQDRIKKLNREKTALQTEIRKAKKAAANLPRYKKEMEELKRQFEEIAVVLPKKKEIPELLRNISDLGKSAGLDFLSFKPGKEIPRDFYAEIPINISIRGPYHNMGYFLDRVSKLDRLVTVNNIKMGSPKREGGEMLLNSTCRLLTYRFTGQQVQKDKKKNKKKRRKR